MLWQFEELAYPFSINYCPNGTINNNCRTDLKPIRWDYNTDPRRVALFNVYAKMANLRKRENYAYENLFVNGFITKDFNNDVKWLRLTDPALNLIVIANYGVSTASNYALSFPTNGKWYNYLTGDSITVSGNSFNFNLTPGQYHVFTSKNFNPTVLTAIGNINAPILNIKISIYPNPLTANVTGNIKLNLPESGNLAVSLVNIAGQEIMPIFKGTRSRGTQLLQFTNNKGLPVGLYLIKTVLNGKTRLDKVQLF